MVICGWFLSGVSAEQELFIWVIQIHCPDLGSCFFPLIGLIPKKLVDHEFSGCVDEACFLRFHFFLWVVVGLLFGFCGARKRLFA